MTRITIRILFVIFVASLLSACEPKTAPDTAAGAIDEDAAWLIENAKRQGVVVTGSGLQYEIITSGQGRSPGPTDTVSTHYEGTFINGEVFDSSLERGQPAEFPVDRVIKAWTEALQLMKEGDKWRLFVPSELGYGSKGVGPIPGDTTLIFEVELLEVKSG